MERVEGPLLKEVAHPGEPAGGRKDGRPVWIYWDYPWGPHHLQHHRPGEGLRPHRLWPLLVSSDTEARGVDLHVLFQTLKSTTGEHAILRKAFTEGYGLEFPGFAEVLAREQEIEHRGRYL